MFKKLIVKLAVFINLFAISCVVNADEVISASTESLHKLIQQYESSWNKHDIESLSTIFTNHVSFITVTGIWIKDREEFFKIHAKLHHEAYKYSSIFAKEYSIEFLKPDLALVHWYWEIKGVLNPDGSEKNPYSGIFTWLVENQKGEWRVRASHNTIKL